MARFFNGGTDSIKTSSGGYYPGSGSNQRGCTVFWMKTTQTLANTHVASLWDSGSRNGFGFIMNNTANKLLCILYNGSSSVNGLGNVTTVNDGVWHHIALNWSQFSGESCDMYIDGVLETSANNSGAFVFFGSRPQIGKGLDNFWGAYVGDIAEWGTWDRKLAVDEIYGLSRGIQPGLVVRGLWGHLPLVRPVIDLSINQLPLSVTGTSISDHPRSLGGRTGGS